jgi:hypothetical protein
VAVAKAAEFAAAGSEDNERGCKCTNIRRH